jgi:hypothetical protein
VASAPSSAPSGHLLPQGEKAQRQCWIGMPINASHFLSSGMTIASPAVCAHQRKPGHGEFGAIHRLPSREKGNARRQDKIISCHPAIRS